MANVTLGEQNYTELPSRRRYDPKRGNSTERRFKGSADAIESLAATLKSQGYITEITEGPRWELSASIGLDVIDGNPQGGEEVTTVWEISASAGEIELVRSPLVDAVDAADRKLLRDLAKGQRAFSDTGSGDFVDGESVTLFNLMADGMTSRRIFYPTLRSTETANDGYIYPNATSGVGEVYSSANVIGANQIPTSVINQMPTSSSVTRNGLTFYYGWMYLYPSVQVTNGNKVQRIKEWEWGLWPSDIYTYHA